MDIINELKKKNYIGNVVYLPLKDTVIPLQKDTLKTSELIVDGKYPVINSGRSFYGRYNDFNNYDAITIAARGEYAGYVNYIDGKFWAGGLCYPYKSKDENQYLTKYIYFVLKKSQQYIRDTLVARGSIPALNKQDIDKFEIPIPPINIQQSIVDILNNFVKLETNLGIELEARKQQYEYYRDKLLSFENLADGGGSVKWLKIGDICEVFTGGEPPKNFIRSKTPDENHIYPVYSNGIGENALWGYSDTYAIDKDAVTFSSIGTIGHPTIRKANFTPIIRLKAIIPRDDKQLSIKYLKYVLEVIDFSKQYSSVPNVNSSMIKKIKIPLPSMKIQKRITYVLDNFDAVCNDLSIGLPAEIEARQKQYEYYRDRLLSFDDAIEGGVERERES